MLIEWFIADKAYILVYTLLLYTLFFKILRRIVIGVFDYFASNQNSEIDTQENPIEPLNPRLSPYKTRNC